MLRVRRVGLLFTAAFRPEALTWFHLQPTHVGWKEKEGKLRKEEKENDWYYYLHKALSFFFSFFFFLLLLLLSSLSPRLSG